MVNWSQFADEAPHIAEVFTRRHLAANYLCLMATNRSDGYPRISPVEPRVFENELVLIGMPGTTKYRDLGRDPKLSIHTATIDPQVTDGDAKIWAMAKDLRDETFHVRFLDDLFETSGYDFRGEKFDPFYVADITGGSTVEVDDHQLLITIWKPGEGERVEYRS